MEGGNDSNMASKPSLATLPADLVQGIGTKLRSPRDLVMFSAVCKHVHSVIGVITELAMRDVKILIEQWKRPFCVWNSNRIRGRTKPLLIRVIETGKDINHIKRCIEVYNQSYPGFISGFWNRLLVSQPELLINPGIPITRAAAFGRLDVIKALLEFGADMHIHGDRTFDTSCRLGDEDITCFLISNGLEMKSTFLWLAAHCNCLKTLSLLVQHPFFDEEYHGVSHKTKTLRDYFYQREKPNHEVVHILLDAMHKPNSEKIESVRPILDKLLSPWDIHSLPKNPAADGPKVIFLLGIIEKLSDQPIEASDIFREAAKYDHLLDAMKLMLSGHPWIVGQSDEERSQVMQEAFNISLSFGSSQITQFLLDQGCKYSAINLYQAIHARNLDLMEKVIGSGVSVNCSFDFDRGDLNMKIFTRPTYYRETHPEPRIDGWLDDILDPVGFKKDTGLSRLDSRCLQIGHGVEVRKTPLLEALHMYRHGKCLFNEAFKLLSLGADYKNIPEEDKIWLYKCLWDIVIVHHSYKLDTFHTMRSNSDKSAENSTQLNLAEAFSKLPPDRYIKRDEMLDRMA
ncbi:hypothetical protein F5B19DRAFT_437242 [Rostrohypoxylon terebratum]|nr:hypothetical protein F5B19DRAFT_437242 [Rostrohypoxylon terebratum]